MKKTILAFGSTGLGKTTMARLLCGIDVEGSNGIKSATSEAKLYRTDEFIYIDTRGFDDSSGKTDNEIFHDIMRLLYVNKTNNIFIINTILWFCCESERVSGHLKREAKFIQRFIDYTDGYSPIDLWENVLIITKGVFQSEELVDGPKSAAEIVCQESYNMQINEVKHFPCWIYNIKGSKKKGPVPDNYYRQDEIKSKIQHLISNISPIEVHFREGKCQNCNAIGDPRLFAARCHPSLIFKHSIEIEYFHPEQKVSFHSGCKFLTHQPDEFSVDKFFEKLIGNVFDSNPTRLPASQVSSEIGRELIEIYNSDLTVNQIQATPESQPSRMSRVISHVSQAVSQQVVVSFPILLSAIVRSKSMTNSMLSDHKKTKHSSLESSHQNKSNGDSSVSLDSVSGSKGDITGKLLLAAGVSVAVLVVYLGRTVYYYETKNISCKMCKKLVGEKGCIKICESCGEEWEKPGCATQYDCCKRDMEKPGCQARKKCTMCQEAAIELNSQGCTQYCVGCKEMWNTSGCDPSSDHVVTMD
jgi:hypothetical protein